jgi:hypothetical protein
MLCVIIKDLIKSERYSWWTIPVFLYIVYVEYTGFYNLLGNPIGNHFIIFLTGISLIQLGAIGFLMLKNIKNIER